MSSIRRLVCLSMVLFGLVSKVASQKCEDTVLKCIKDINSGSYPVSRSTPLKLLLNRHYSIVWYSNRLIQKENLKCITTIFGVFGAQDTCYHSCTDTEKIHFIPTFNIFDQTFTIHNYKGLTVKSYAVYDKKHCLGFYVCSPTGEVRPHVTIYCPTRILDLTEVKEEIEEAKAQLTTCNINDGEELCTEKCYLWKLP